MSTNKRLTLKGVDELSRSRTEAVVSIQDVLAKRIATLDNKVARLEHHFVTLDKQMSKQARRIEELEKRAGNFEERNTNNMASIAKSWHELARRIEELESAQARQGDSE